LVEIEFDAMSILKAINKLSKATARLIVAGIQEIKNTGAM
jgi:hypothetical protein